MNDILNREIVVSDDELNEIKSLIKNNFIKVFMKNEAGDELMSIDDITLHKLTQKHRIMTETEFVGFIESIALVGQIEPVLLYRGKIVDGRHRYWALKKLGAKYIKVKKLSNNLTLSEVEEIVLNTEVRRSDNSFQKAAKAILEYQFANKEISLNEIARRNQVSKASVVKLKAALDELGVEVIKEIYAKGKVKVDDRYYSGVSALYEKALKIRKDRQTENDGGSDLKKYPELKDAVDMMKTLSAKGDTEKLGYLVKIAKRELSKALD